MFGEIEIRINAAHPNLPLAPLAAFAGSPSTVRVLGVPGAVGRSRISQVSLVVVRPDNSIRSVPCVFADGVWTGSLAAFDESVRIVNGFRVVADGSDENGNEVTGYVLGVGDVEILALDGTVTPGKTIYYLHFVSEIPESPNYADVAKFGDGIRMWDGAAWQPFAVADTSHLATKEELEAIDVTLGRVSERTAMALAKAQEAATAADAAKTKADDAGNAASAASNAIVSHKEDHSNPHAVTAEQIGAFPKSNSESPTTYELGWNPVFGGISIFDPGFGNVTGAATVYADGKIVQRATYILTIPDKTGTLATTDDLAAKLDTSAYSKDMVGITRMIKMNEVAIGDLEAKVDAANARLEVVA